MTRHRMFYLAGSTALSLALCASSVVFGQDKKDEKDNRQERPQQEQRPQEPRPQPSREQQHLPPQQRDARPQTPQAPPQQPRSVQPQQQARPEPQREQRPQVPAQPARPPQQVQPQPRPQTPQQPVQRPPQQQAQPQRPQVPQQPIQRSQQEQRSNERPAQQVRPQQPPQPQAQQAQRFKEPPPQRTQEQARVWQQQRGFAGHGGWQGHASLRDDRDHNWAADHRTWAQRGGYGGYFIPQDRFYASFGPQHWFRIGVAPVIYDGYPRFSYGGYSFLIVDPWPDYWPDDWYLRDDVYVAYNGDGYYLYDRNYPGIGIAVSILV